MPKFDFFKKLQSKFSNNYLNYSDGDFLTEFSEEHPTYDNYISKGVALNTEGNNLSVNYEGLLAKNGAEDIFAVVNYGDNTDWDNAKYYKMDKNEQNTFNALLPINENINLNIAFKDGANNWDNNSGKNYNFISH